jgi:CubicO group peptidase (beta-lactamase class C family)
MRPSAPRTLIVASLLVAACGAPPEPATPVAPPPATAAPVATVAEAPPPPAKPAPERLAADSPRVTAGGASFTAPSGWAITTQASLSVLETPEPDAHLAIFDAPAASGGADAAVAAAWAAYQPGFKRPLRLASPRPARKGWDERRVYEYETSPNERLVVVALALRHGEAWTVLLIDAAEPTLERRGAATQLVQDSLRPKGYARETFAGKKAHPLDKERVEQIKSFVEASMRDLGVPGAGLALIDGGKVVFEGGLGVRELGKKPRVDKDTQFAIASNTKGMTTLLLARLVDEGKLAWDEPVTKAYPGFKLGDADTTAKVLVEHLVCACTGLPRQDMEWIFEYGKMTPKSGMDLLGTMQPTSKFGEVFQYSNVLAAAGGWVAGHVVYPDKELGAAYDEAMKKLVFDPLGMKGTTMDLARVEKGNHARPHAEDLDGKPTVAKMALNRAVVPFRPAGGAWTSVHEMTRYVELELSRGLLPDGKRFISEKNLLARRAPHVTIGEDTTYGMGLEVDKTWGAPMVHHGGSLFGYKSDWIIFPEQGVGAILLTNSDNGGLLLRPFARRVAEVLFDGRPEAVEDVASRVKAHAAELAKFRERLVIPADPTAVGKLAAHYLSPELGELTIKKDGAATVFDAGEFSTPVASRKNDDGTLSFVTLEPTLVGVELVVGERGGKRVLVLRDAQHEYVFTEG